MTLPLPAGAEAILRTRTQLRLKPRDAVVVSFVGRLALANPIVLATSGERYDWTFLRGLEAHVYVREGVDAKHAMVEIFDECDTLQSYPALVDVDRKQIAFIVGNRPLRLWPVRNGSDLWRGFFE
jgi:hypothetical protein